MEFRRTKARLAQRALGAGLVFVVPWIACVREPDVNKMKCTPAKGCPSGYVCTDTGAGWYCRTPRDGGAAADGPGFTALDAGDANRAGNGGSVDAQSEGTGNGGASGGGADGGHEPGSGGAIGSDGAQGTGGSIEPDAAIGSDANDAPMASGGISGSGGTAGSTTNTGGVATGGSHSTGGALGTGGSSSLGGTPGTGGTAVKGSGGVSATGGSGGSGGVGTGGIVGTGGVTSSGGVAGVVGTGGAGGGTGGAPGTGGSTSANSLPGDIAKTAGTPFVAAHSMTRSLFAAYTGPLFRALRVADLQEMDIGIVASTGLVDSAALGSFCSGTSCRVATLYDQSGNGNDMWRADSSTANQPGAVKTCDLLDIQYWQMADGTKVPIAVESGAMWKSTAQCLRNRDKTKSMPTGAKPQTEYAVFHGQYLNNNCCFDYGNTTNAIHYTGPGAVTALNFSKTTFWSKGAGDGPWPMVDFQNGVLAGNIAKCGSGVPATTDCTATGENTNPSVTFDVVTMLFKHNGVSHWAMKTGNAKSGGLLVNVDLGALPTGYSPLAQEGGLSLGEGGAGDTNGTGGFSEGAVIAAETLNGTDDAIQASIVSVYGK